MFGLTLIPVWHQHQWSGVYARGALSRWDSCSCQEIRTIFSPNESVTSWIPLIDTVVRHSLGLIVLAGIRTNNFAHYDYGNPARNVQAYGQADPPAYNVEQIPRRLPILIVGGGRDWFAPPQGIRLLLSQLLQQVTFINLTNYAHYDLQFSVRRETDVYLPILQYLEGPKFQWRVLAEDHMILDEGYPRNVTSVNANDSSRISST